jgi:hypothetical protein
VAELLLASGADVNAKTTDGATPLYGAAANGHDDVVDLLLANHALNDPTALKGQQSATVLLLAHDKKEREAARIAKQPIRNSAKRNVVAGALWCGGGIIATSIGHSMAGPGGGYLVFWGAIVFGGWRFMKGLVQLAGE